MRKEEISNQLAFKSHNLCIHVFSAGDAHVYYAADSSDLFLNKVSIAKPKGWDDRSPSGKSGPYPAFAGPLGVRWKSLDRKEHACELDLAQLMPEPKVLPPTNLDEIYWEKPFVGPLPSLIVEIDDRKLSLYIHVVFRLRQDSLVSGGRRFSQQKSLVYSKEF